MTTFDLYQSDDKGLGYPAEQDDPQPLFDRFLDDDSTQLIADYAEPDRLEVLDFNFDFDEDTATSESQSL